MIKVNYQEKNLVLTILTDSFKDNQSVNYIVRQDSHGLKGIRALMDYSFEVCYHSGEIWLSDDRKASALLLFPHVKRTTLCSIWLDIKLIFKVIGLSGIQKAMKRETQIKKLQPKEKMAYLWFIGVNTVDQHQGIGSKLLKEVIADAALKNLPVYLETSAAKNLPWYERFGFQIYDQLDLGYKLYFLKRNPVNP